MGWAMLFHGLGHEYFKKGFPRVEPGKNLMGYAMISFEKVYLGWARWNLMGWAMSYVFLKS